MNKSLNTFESQLLCTRKTVMLYRLLTLNVTIVRHPSSSSYREDVADEARVSYGKLNIAAT